MAQGQGFIDYAMNSLLVKSLLELGLISKTEVGVEEKDYGDGAIAYFDVGYVYFSLPEKPNNPGFHTDDQFGNQGPDIMVYHSRFSDTWYFHVHGQRYENWGHKIEDMNKPNIVANIVAFTKERLGL